MPFSELEARCVQRAVDEFMDRFRLPPATRPQLDFGFRISGQSLELFELPPAWDNPFETLESGIAKATYVKKTGGWKVYWQRADMRWHPYDPAPEVESVEEFLALVEADPHACFFGWVKIAGMMGSGPSLCPGP